jgi:hypothetical protein
LKIGLGTATPAANSDEKYGGLPLDLIGNNVEGFNGT